MRKPVIGIIGGIGAGKSHVSKLLGELGCLVIDSDALSRRVYEMPEVIERLITRFGMRVFRSGKIDRKAIGKIVFNNPTERQWLEKLTHPIINKLRDELQSGADDSIRAFVWDSPLLIEAGLADQCDLLIFIDTPKSLRIKRVKTRGWDEAELDRREAAQVSLEQKRALATHVVKGDLDQAALRDQLSDILRI
ncbi:MAG TPA: dephospho-CoA kinase [Tepidisphaeraceae bacterium]|nr:dephospho-CoA kinase [Tepidisphaeraceae bacterium]